jgi:tetrahydromethanopterin S-methyltransferase subunit G
MPRPGENVTQTNGLATASLVLGILSGLVVGILFIALITTSFHQVDHFGPSRSSSA